MTVNADKLVKAYIKIRSERDTIKKTYEEQDAKLVADMAAIEGELLELCKSTGQDGGKTAFGTFTRTTKSRYWTSDWDSFYKVVNEFQSPELLEQRIHQGNFKKFITDNPAAFPAGVNVDTKYSITVRRPTASK